VLEIIDRFVPDLATTIVVLPLTLVFASAAAAFVGWLRVRRGVRVPYTRKIFHFIILSVATGVHLAWGLPGTVVYGSVVAIIVIAAVLRGDGHPFYEAIARPTDAPRRSLLIVVPLITTALGGVLANVFFPAWAFVGYAAVAWGDAIGEPVGTRWGRHPYRVPSIGGLTVTRSVEGSAAVLIASTLACGFALIAAGIDLNAALPAAGLVGLVTMLVEAVSHHGTDNFTIQLAAAGVATLLLG
jgi:phytol kinase